MLLYLSHRDLKHLKLDSFVAVTLITTGFFLVIFCLLLLLFCCCFLGGGGHGLLFVLCCKSCTCFALVLKVQLSLAS